MFELRLHKPDERTGLGVMGKRYGGLIECERIIAMKLREYKEKKENFEPIPDEALYASNQNKCKWKNLRW